MYVLYRAKGGVQAVPDAFSKGDKKKKMLNYVAIAVASVTFANSMQVVSTADICEPGDNNLLILFHWALVDSDKSDCDFMYALFAYHRLDLTPFLADTQVSKFLLLRFCLYL